ncbi:MAG: hypothetical protein WBA13_16650 [Microcoleaceae cyanobacterium]
MLSGLISLWAVSPGMYFLNSPQAHSLALNRSHSAQHAQARRRIRIPEIGSQVYQQFPDLPKENRYISQETGEIAESDTLVGRFIRYHLYIKGRSPLSRFDWKLTVADYLGANEVMFESQYPSSTTLNENPMVSDRSAMNNLTRSQRNNLVNAIVKLFNPNLPDDSSSQPATNSPNPQLPDSSSPRTTPLPPQPQPGDADLLK